MFVGPATSEVRESAEVKGISVDALPATGGPIHKLLGFGLLVASIGTVIVVVVTAIGKNKGKK